MLKPCPHRRAEEDGRITCQKIVRGDNEVAPDICRGCPAAGINCSHLRFTLEKIEQSRLLVRYGNGRTETWEAEPPKVALSRGACAAKIIPIETPAACAGCTVRHVVVPAITPRPGERPQPGVAADRVA